MFKENNVKIAYLRQDDRLYENNIEKCKKIIRKLFCIVSLENIKSGNIILIPNYKEYSRLKERRVLNKIKRYIQNCKITYLFIDKNIKINSLNLPVIKEKVLMKKQVLPILKYIFSINKEIINMENIYILVNEYNDYNLYMIKELIKEFKTVNIITENIRKYKRFENLLYEDGILITVSNNRKKSMRNAKYIINVDFDGDAVSNYKLYSKAIIINLTNELLFFDKSFNGVVINDYTIDLDKNEEEYIDEFYGKIDKKKFVESTMLVNQENNYEIKISGLIGTRGILPIEEFLKSS